MVLQSEPHVQKSPSRKGVSVSEVIEIPDSEVFLNTQDWKKVAFYQQLSNAPSGVPSCEGDNVDKGSKKPNMIDISSNGIMTSARLDNKPKQKYGLFDKFPLSVIGSCEVHNNPHIFLTRENQHIQ